MRHDPVLADVIRRAGPCGLSLRARGDVFEALVRAITNQQLSGKAAATIYGRVRALARDAIRCGPGVAVRAWTDAPDGDGFVVTPEALLSVERERLRAAGLSTRKAEYVHGLSEMVRSGALRLDLLETLPDEEVMAALTSVRGLGRWSAEMILIFVLQRPDVLPVDDVGILRAAQKVYKLRSRPTPKRLERLAEPWRPWRSVACWYLWKSLE